MLVHYQTLLQAVTADPGTSIAQLPLLTDAEYSQIVFDWNRTERSYPKEKCLDELIEEQIERTPDAVAVVFEGEQSTYRQLGDRANDLACYLRELGVGRNTLVAICVERSLDILVGLLGILKAGGAYLPLDPMFPPDRLAFMLNDAQPHVLLTHRRLLTGLPVYRAQVVCLDKLPLTKSKASVSLRTLTGRRC